MASGRISENEPRPSETGTAADPSEGVQQTPEAGPIARPTAPSIPVRAMRKAGRIVLRVAGRAKSAGWLAINQTRKRIAALPPVSHMKRFVFDRLMARMIARLPERESPAVPQTVRQMLIFGDMGLGNFLMFTPALRTLRRRFPSAEIVALFFKARGAEVIAAGNPDIDRLVIIDTPKRAGMLPLFRLVMACRREQIEPDMIVARWNGNPYVALLTAWLRPRTRLGHVSSGGYKGYADAVFNFPVTMTEEQHEVERNLDLARAMGAEPATYEMHMPVAEADGRRADALIARHGFDPARLIALQTGSSKLQKWKRWPERYWAALATRLAESGYDLAFVGSGDEADVAQRIVGRTPIAGHLGSHIICGDLSVNETAAFLARCAGIICNDSGLMHVAAAVGTPIIGLFGPTEYDRTRPFVDNCVVLRKPCHCNHGTLFDRQTLAAIEACDRPCLTGTAPEEVLAEVARLMARPAVSPAAPGAGA